VSFLNGHKPLMVDQNSLFLMTKMTVGDGHGVLRYAVLFMQICDVLLHGEGKRRSKVVEDYTLR
jgi:hypothetical protein